MTHDWEISKRIREQCPLPVILAGGLNPQNVSDAIKKVNPFAVDVNSGVEKPGMHTDGKKDPDLLKAFITTAKTIE
jgi:phosphoribosylanthranilate isomerase